MIYTCHVVVREEEGDPETERAMLMKRTESDSMYEAIELIRTELPEELFEWITSIYIHEGECEGEEEEEDE